MRQRGMTLVELLVTVTISAILLGIGLPGYGYFVNQSRLVGLTNEMVGALNFTRSEAIKRGVRVTMCTTSGAGAAGPACESGTGWEQGWLIFVDGGVTGVKDAGDQILWVKSQPTPNIAVLPSNFTDYASYLPSGVSEGEDHLATGHFLVCLSGTGRLIKLNRIGRIRVESKAC